MKLHVVAQKDSLFMVMLSLSEHREVWFFPPSQLEVLSREVNWGLDGELVKGRDMLDLPMLNSS